MGGASRQGVHVAGWLLALLPVAVWATEPPVDRPMVSDDGTVKRVIVPEMQPLIARMLPINKAGALPDGALIEGVSLKAERVEIKVLFPDRSAGIFALVSPTGRPGPNEPANFVLRAQEVPAGLAVARRMVLETALKQLVIAGEAGFEWREVRAKVTLAGTDPRLKADLEAARRKVGSEGGGAARELADHWPAETAGLFAAWDIGVLLLEVGEQERAAAYFDRILERFQDAVGRTRVPAAVWSRAAAANYLRRSQSAGDKMLLGCADQASDGPADCQPWEMARIAELRGDDGVAKTYMEAALGDGSKASLGNLNSRIALATRNNDSAAELKWAKVAAARFADQPEALQALGGALFRQRNFEEAVRVYERLFKLAPKRPGVLGHLSGAFNRLGGEVRTGKRPGERYYALVDEMAKRAEQGDALGRFLQAVDLFYGGDFDGAIEKFAALEGPLGHEARVYIYGAMAHHWQGEDEEAARLSKRAVEVGPNDPDVYYCRSHIVRRTDAAAAVADLKRYVALAEGPGAIRFDDKTDRIRNEIKLLEQGIMPPDWDRPGGPMGGRHTRMAIAAGIGLLLAGAAIWLIRRRRRRAA